MIVMQQWPEFNKYNRSIIHHLSHPKSNSFSWTIFLCFLIYIFGEMLKFHFRNLGYDSLNQHMVSYP